MAQRPRNPARGNGTHRGSPRHLRGRTHRRSPRTPRRTRPRRLRRLRLAARSHYGTNPRTRRSPQRGKTYRRSLGPNPLAPPRVPVPGRRRRHPPTPRPNRRRASHRPPPQTTLARHPSRTSPRRQGRPPRRSPANPRPNRLHLPPRQQNPHPGNPRNPNRPRPNPSLRRALLAVGNLGLIP